MHTITGVMLTRHAASPPVRRCGPNTTTVALAAAALQAAAASHSGSYCGLGLVFRCCSCWCFIAVVQRATPAAPLQCKQRLVSQADALKSYCPGASKCRVEQADTVLATQITASGDQGRLTGAYQQCECLLQESSVSVLCISAGVGVGWPCSDMCRTGPGKQHTAQRMRQRPCNS